MVYASNKALLHTENNVRGWTPGQNEHLYHLEHATPPTQKRLSYGTAAMQFLGNRNTDKSRLCTWFSAWRPFLACLASAPLRWTTLTCASSQDEHAVWW
jgi:hypothetical protein